MQEYEKIPLTAMVATNQPTNLFESFDRLVDSHLEFNQFLFEYFLLLYMFHAGD